MKPLCPSDAWIGALNAQALDRDLARLHLESDLVALNTHLPLLTPWCPVQAIEHARLVAVTAQSLQRLDRAIRETVRALEIAVPFEWPDRAAYGGVAMQAKRLAEFLRESVLAGDARNGRRVGMGTIGRLTQELTALHLRVQSIHIAVHDLESVTWRWMADHRIGDRRADP